MAKVITNEDGTYSVKNVMGILFVRDIHPGHGGDEVHGISFKKKEDAETIAKKIGRFQKYIHWRKLGSMEYIYRR